MDLGGGVVSHDEVVAVVVLHLMDGDGFREGKDAPVGEAADDAAIPQDETPYGCGNPRRQKSCVRISFVCLSV